MKYIFLSFFISSWAQAWTLNNNFSAAFKDSEVKVSVDQNTICDNAFPNGTIYEFQDLIKPAINNFWNEVPTSALRLKDGGFSPAVANMNNGILCSPTDQDCITDAGSALIPKVKDIVIACNNEADNFGGNNVLAVTIPNSFSGKKITGAVILINNYSAGPNTNYFGKLSRKDQIAVIAHEIGHAIGLGHSDDTDALMYYRTVDQRQKLGQDDVDGVSFLYPMQVDAFGLLKGGLLGGCGTIIFNDKQPPKDPPFSQMGITLAVVVLIGEFARLLRSRSKARSAA